MIENTAQRTPSLTAELQSVRSKGLVAWMRGFQPSTALFWGVHVAAVIMAIAFFSWWGVLVAIGCYFVRMVVVTAAYHR